MIKKFNLNMWISTSEDGIHWEYRPNREDILKKINELIDVVNTFEPKHGRWIDIEPAPWGQVYETCSECGVRQTLDKGKDKYCGICGAKMEVTNEEMPT